MRRFYLHISNLISEAKIPQALELLKQSNTKVKKSDYKSILNCNFQFYSLENAFQKGIITYQDYTIQLNRIADFLLSIVILEAKKKILFS